MSEQTHKCRFGVIVPWMNRAVESELPHTVPQDLTLHWSRVRPTVMPSNPNDDGYIPSFIDAIPVAVQDLAPIDIHKVVVACTSAALVAPDRLSAWGLLAVTDCILEALSQRRSRRLLVASPYSSDLAGKLCDFLEDSGFRVTNYIPIPSAGEYRDITIEDIGSRILESSNGDHDSVVLSCTALHTQGLAQHLSLAGETRPVISSVSAISESLTSRCSTCPCFKASRSV